MTATCQICQQDIYLGDFVPHIKKLHKIVSHQCPICKLKEYKVKSLQNHLRTQHQYISEKQIIQPIPQLSPVPEMSDPDSLESLNQIPDNSDNIIKEKGPTISFISSNFQENVSSI